MGGTGSGRGGGRPTLEATGAVRLTVSHVLQRGKGRHLPKRSGNEAPILAYEGHADLWQDGGWITIRFKAVTNAPERVGFVDFSHVVDSKVSEYRVHLQGQQQPFGGLRWYFECPVTCERVHTLYLPRGASHLASRQAFRMAYQCQRESDEDRAYRRAWKARRRLGGTGIGSTMHETLNTPVTKPRRRHWRTFDRDVTKLERKANVCDLHLYRHAARFGLEVPALDLMQAMARGTSLPIHVPKAIKCQNARRQIARVKRARAEVLERWEREHYAFHQI